MVNLKVFKQFLLSKEKQILLVGIKEGHLEGLLGEGQIQIDGGSNRETDKGVKDPQKKEVGEAEAKILPKEDSDPVIKQVFL